MVYQFMGQHNGQKFCYIHFCICSVRRRVYSATCSCADKPPTSSTRIPRIQQFTAQKNKPARNNPGTKLDIPRNSRRKPWWSQSACVEQLAMYEMKDTMPRQMRKPYLSDNPQCSNRKPQPGLPQQRRVWQVEREEDQVPQEILLKLASL